MRALPDTMSSAVVARIDATLKNLEAEQLVTIPWAIESGSRAWGFPSPDSDHDCRFIFVRRAEDYLSLWPSRDVLETPLDGELDVNGWDLGKALRLVLKGNAVIIEWLRSPIVYQGDVGFRDEFLAFARRFADRTLIGRHYLHLGEKVRRTHLADEEAVPIKKLFYALRPAASLRWLRLHPEAAIAPMNFQTLLAESDLPTELTKIVSELLLRKAETRELGSSALPSPIASFIALEFDRGREEFEGRLVQVPDAAKVEADVFFRKAVERLG